MISADPVLKKLLAFPQLREALDAEAERQRRREEARERMRDWSQATDTDYARRYALSALQREHDNVAAAPDGTRNNTLNKAAFSLGQLVAAGALERHEVEDALNAAAADFPNPN